MCCNLGSKSNKLTKLSEKSTLQITETVTGVHISDWLCLMTHFPEKGNDGLCFSSVATVSVFTPSLVVIVVIFTPRCSEWESQCCIQAELVLYRGHFLILCMLQQAFYFLNNARLLAWFWQQLAESFANFISGYCWKSCDTIIWSHCAIMGHLGWGHLCQ